jgi:hypothetical protein
MAKSILAIYNGNDYQARVFWLQACQSLYSDSKIEKVGYEVDIIKSFDDVAIIYKSPILDEYNDPIRADYWQVKYHVDANGVLTYENLIDPGFINATSKSILQRLHQAQLEFAPNGTGARFHLVSPWHVQPNDPLASLISNNGGEIRLDVLFSNSTKMNRVKKMWKDHLEILTDDKLRNIIRPLRIHTGYPKLQQLRDDLNTHLLLAGLKPVDVSTVSNPYDDLIKKLRGSGQSWFSRNDIEFFCKQEGLWIGKQENHERTVNLGIRSFTRWAENMENETHHMLNLVPYFDGRIVHSPDYWAKKIYPELDKFFLGALKERLLHTLHLDCHASVAFGAGYVVGQKSGFAIAPIQKTVSGQNIWKITSSPSSLSNMWSVGDCKIGDEGKDIGLSISITHSIAKYVQEYIKHSLPNICRIIDFHLLSGIGGKAIENGEQAYCLAQQVVQWLKENRTSQEKQMTLHVFSAAPNGFMFFLGQQAKTVGILQLYEHNFDNPADNDYRPSLKFSPSDE